MKNIITLFLFLFAFAAQSQELISIGNNGKITEYTFEEAQDFATRNPAEAKDLKWYNASVFDVQNIIIQYPLLFESYFLVEGEEKREVTVDNETREIKVENKKGSFYFSSDVSTLFLEFGETVELERSGAGWQSVDGKYQLLQELEALTTTEPVDEKPEKEKMKELYPNSSSLKKLKEVDIVALGKELGIEGVDTKLKASENDKIVIAWFEANIW